MAHWRWLLRQWSQIRVRNLSHVRDFESVTMHSCRALFLGVYGKKHTNLYIKFCLCLQKHFFFCYEFRHICWLFSWFECRTVSHGTTKRSPPPGHHTWKNNIFWQEGPHPPHVKRCHFNLDFLLTKHQYTLAASFEVTKSLQQENESGFLHDLSFPQT